MDPEPKRRKRGGKRCCIGVCTNSTSNSQYTVYGIQKSGRDFKTEEKWRAFVQKSRGEGNFDKKNAITCYVCDGHFTEDSFVEIQLIRFNLGHRSTAPELKLNAVPSIVTATPPHFLKDKKRQPQSREEMEEAARRKMLAPITMTDVAQATMSSEVMSTRGTASRTWRELDRLSKQPAPATVSCPPEETEPIAHDMEEEDQPDPVPTEQNLPHHIRPQRESKNKVIQCRPYFRSKGCQMGESFIVWPLPPCPLVPQPAHPNTPKSMAPPSVPLPPPPPPQPSPVVPATPCPICSAPSEKTVQIHTDHDEEEDDEVGDSEESSDNDSDSSWEPSDEEDKDVDDEVEVEEPYVRTSDGDDKMDKYIVYLDNLMELFQICNVVKCGGDCEVRLLQPKSFGSWLKVKIICNLCGAERQWQSQPKIGDIPAGNLALSKGILFGGESPARFLRTLRNAGIRGISPRTFHSQQSRYLQPAVLTEWKHHQAALLAELKAERRPLILGGDGRADSPGHSAKYGTYTMMDLTSGKIVDIQLVQSNEVVNSNAMEPEGIRRSMNFLKEQGLHVQKLITDRHMTIQKIMREEYPETQHLYDVWHIAKGVKKQLLAESKLKDCGELGDWKKSIINHLYWSASSTPDADGELMAAKFRSIANHVIDKHEGFSEHPEFTKCQHEIPVEKQRRWMTEGSKAHDALCDVILKKYLVSSLKKMSPGEQTSKVEAFHYVLCLFAPKLLSFSYAGMKCRCYIAVLHWNENGNRPQAVKKTDGALQYRVSYPRAKQGEAAVKKVLQPCTYAYVEALSTEASRLVEERIKTGRGNLHELQDMAPVCSNYDQPPKEDVVRKHLAQSRFNKK